MAINIGDFMDIYKSKKTEEKENFVKEHVINRYVPYEQKADVAKAIVDSSCWKTEKTSDGNLVNVLQINSVAKYMLTYMAMVDLYTDIERQKTDGKILEDFNVLNSFRVFDLIIANIDSRELKEFNMIVKMTYDDLMTNEYENHAFISKQLHRFGELIGVTLSPIISQLDMSKIERLINEFQEK